MTCEEHVRTISRFQCGVLQVDVLFRPYREIVGSENSAAPDAAALGAQFDKGVIRRLDVAADHDITLGFDVHASLSGRRS